MAWHDDGPFQHLKEGDTISILPPKAEGKPLVVVRLVEVRQHALIGVTQEEVKVRVTIVGRELRCYVPTGPEVVRVTRNVKLGCKHGMPRPLGCMQCISEAISGEIRKGPCR